MMFPSSLVEDVRSSIPAVVYSLILEQIKSANQ